MSKLTRIEQETIVVFNEEDQKAIVDTHNRSWKKKLRELSEKFPNDVVKEKEDEDGVTYSIPKKWIKLRAPRIMSEEEREMRANILKASLYKNRR